MGTNAHSYTQEALSEPLHALTLPAALILAAYAVFSGRWAVLAVAAALELGYLLLYPLRPAFRRKCEAGWARDDAQARRDEVARIAQRLGENARARLRSLERHRDQILDQLAAWREGQSLQAAWQPRLEELVSNGLRLLLAIDAGAPNVRAAHADDGELARLRQELAASKPGPARDAKAQRLELLEARAGRGPNLAEQREAAVVQFDTLEDLFEDLERAALEGRDAAAFGARLAQVNALVEATRQSVAALESHQASAGELAEARRLN